MELLTGFVLVGGKSRRMGTDKAMLPWHGGTLLDHMTQTLGTVANTVRIVGSDELPDRFPDRGPIEGIATALAATATTNNLIVAVDLPYLETTFLEYFVSVMNQSETGFVRCTISDQTPLCLGIRRDLFTAIDDYIESGGRSVHGLVETLAHDTISEDQLIQAGFSADVFRNINTPDDYSQAKKA